MMFVLLVGLLAVLAVAASFVVWTRWPTHLACPSCETPTVPVTWTGIPEAVRARAWLRWCGACGWRGVARRGPDLEDGPVDHRSGFRWNPAPADHAPTFLWAPDRRPGDAVRPTPLGSDPTPTAGTTGPVREESSSHGPSGFAWAEPVEPDELPDHPSGFRWRAPRESIRFAGDPADAADPGAPASDHPSGFRWARGEGDR